MEFRGDGSVGGDEPDVGDGDDAADEEGEFLERRVAALEDENGELRELVDEQARQLQKLTGRVAALEETEGQADVTETVVTGGARGDYQSDDLG